MNLSGGTVSSTHVQIASGVTFDSNDEPTLLSNGTILVSNARLNASGVLNIGGLGAGLSLSAGFGLSVGLGLSASIGVAIGGESAAEFAARVGVDAGAWRGLEFGGESSLSLSAGVEIGFSAGLNASAGLGVTLLPVAPPFGRIIVRSSLPLASLRGALTQAVVAAAPDASISYDTITSYVYDSLVTQRIMASLSGFFGVLAMLIASVGLYGAMSYPVTQRQVEIGIRMALGADPGAVVNMVLKESGLLLAGGVAAGLALALFVSRYAEALLFGLQARDPLSFASAAAVLAAVSLLAAWIPARRASRVAPTVALRPE